MASAQQLIGLVKSHAEGDEERFFDLAMQLAAAEEQRGHTRLAEQLRQWAEASKTPKTAATAKLTPLAAPRGDLAGILGARYPTTTLNDLILPDHLFDELSQIVVETRKRDLLEEKGLHPRRRLLFSGPPGTGKTLSAEALAGELKFPLFTVLLHGLITKFMGETAQKLRLIFDAIRTTRGVYLFDEIDALAASRGNENDDVLHGKLLCFLSLGPSLRQDPEKACRLRRARETERRPETSRGPGWSGQPQRGNTARTDAGLRARGRTGLGDCQSKGWHRG